MPGAADRFTPLYGSQTKILDPLYHLYSISYLDARLAFGLPELLTKA